MEYCLSHHKSPSLPSTLRPHRSHNSSFPRSAVVSIRATTRRKRSLTVIAGPAGKALIGVLLNHPQLFHLSVADELKHLADDRDAARNRMIRSDGSPEACLHRRIAQLKENECQVAVEDIMYLLIFYKFSEIKVPLVPRLSGCVYNGRLEIWPPKDWELESIYSFEVLEIVREHIAAVIGLRANSSITDHWAITTIAKSALSRIYIASILYGYFLKSALLRLQLEQCVALDSQDLPLRQRTTVQHHGIKNLLFGRIGSIQSESQSLDPSSQEKKPENLKCYVMGFDPETLQRCAKLKSKEATSLIENHSSALFGDEKTGSLDDDEVILTSFSSLKRLVLEAVAFGSFLWETEECVNTVYKLKEN
ncbi:hypothetical protein L484_015816 [Morus notabilis]|uniref:UV-B-induced protein n=1 Tax=Morus notabilis TaxID=981085 RepID=W9RDN5_9ROSA|nr:UV-B-induced protein At3g17800, chloroplastic [Morus notabilis]EXB84485.1 hypothetical protein L484_015816 [Morus notabilis]